MGLKLQIENDNYIFKGRKIPIIESFIDFLDCYGYIPCGNLSDLLLDLKDTKNIEEFYAKIEKISIFYLPVLIFPKDKEDNLKKLSSLNSQEKEDLENWLQDLLDEMLYLSDYISRFKRALDICFNVRDTSYKDLTFNERYALCIYSKLLPKSAVNTNTYINLDYPLEISSLFNDNLENNYAIIKKTREPKLSTYIEFTDIESMCLYSFNKMLEQHTLIKNCKHCGKLFIADNKKEYCNRIQKNNLTCYQIGSKNLFKEKKKNDILLQEYMKAYKRIQNFYYKNSDTINEDTKNKLFQNLRNIYDIAKTDTANRDKYLKKFLEYNYTNLKSKYL